MHGMGFAGLIKALPNSCLPGHVILCLRAMVAGGPEKLSGCIRTGVNGGRRKPPR